MDTFLHIMAITHLCILLVLTLVEPFTFGIEDGSTPGRWLSHVVINFTLALVLLDYLSK